MKEKKYKRILKKEDFISWDKTKKVPSNVEKKINGIPWIKWGLDNEYNLFLNTLLAQSPSHSGIINSKIYYLTAGGYTITPKVKTAENELNIKLFEANGVSDYNLSELLVDFFRDSELYDQYAIKGKWDFRGEKPAYLEHVNADDIRVNENESLYFYSKNWSSRDQTNETTGFKIYKPVDLNNRVGEFLIWVKGNCKKTEKGEYSKYPIPIYNGAIESIMTQIEYKKFRLNEVFNGYKIGTIVTFPNPTFDTTEDEDEFVDNIKNGATANNASGGVAVVFTEGEGNDKPEVIQLNGNDLDKRYESTEQTVIDMIMTAHSVTTPALFGIRVPGSLNTQELEIGFEIFKKTYVTARQQSINTTLTWILKKLYNIDAEFKMNLPPPIIGNADESNLQAITLSELNPVLTAKVLENITGNEARALAGYKPIEEDPLLEEEMSATDPILRAFAKVGKKKSIYILHESNRVPQEALSDWFDTSENEIREKLKTQKLYMATLLNENQKNVLKLLNDGNTPTAISKALNLPVGDVMNIYNELSKKGLVKKNGDLSESGKKYLDVNEIPADKFEIRYSYELRPDAPKLSKKGTGESRPFCKKLMELDRLYTREEIDLIGVQIGRNVWQYKGGWYTNPDNDKHTPWCRHNWLQQIVILK